MSFNKIAIKSDWLAFLVFSLTIFSFGSLSAQDVAASGVDGKEIFTRNCKSCHAMDRDLTGPMLDGSVERIMDAKGISEDDAIDWLHEWIPNAPGVIESGDPYANALYDEYGTIMTAMPYLTNDEVSAVIDYIQYWDTEKYTPADKITVAGDDSVDEGGVSTNLLLIILVIVLVLVAFVLSRITTVLGRIQKAKEGEEPEPEVPFYMDKRILGIAVVIVIVVAGYFTVDAAIGLNRQQGYQPEQPIPFSHKLHAGLYEIDCKYCHVGAERGKSAVIPSSNICMNCHKFVNKGPTAEFKAQNDLTGPGEDTSEIAKIYAAAGYNPATQEYDKSKAKAIEWVKIHNLPDHVYFSHAQHVKVGEIDCQTCHGPVEEMDVVEQWAPLSMSWCVNCHRETGVQFEKNEYYSDYEEYHEALKDGDINEVTVDMIGGTDCQRCHY